MSKSQKTDEEHSVPKRELYVETATNDSEVDIKPIQLNSTISDTLKIPPTNEDDISLHTTHSTKSRASTRSSGRHLFALGATPSERRGSVITIVTRESFSSFSVTECCKYCIFLVIFTLLMIASRGDGVSNYYVSRDIKSVLESNTFEKSSGISIEPQNIKEITQLSDIYDFVEKIFIPVMMIIQYANGSIITNPADQYLIGQNNKLLGGFRIRQLRAKQKKCFHTDPTKYLCFPNVFGDNKDNVYRGIFRNEYEYQDETDLGESEVFHGILGTYIGGGYVVDFPNNQSESLSKLNYLKYDVSFFDQATRAIFIDFNSYNPSLALHTVSRLSFETPATGGVIIRVEIKTWRFDRYISGFDGTYLLVLEILFILCVISYTMEEFYELYHEGLKNYIQDRWNILDWINLLVFYVTIGWRIHQLALVRDAEKALYDTDSYNSLRNLQWSFQWENYLQMINGFLLWMKIFKYMTFSNRVRFLFTMLQRSSQDLLIFSIVLFVFFLAFGMAAFLAFSSDVNDFRSFGYSIFNLMRYTVTELDYQALKNSNRFLGSMFYVVWSVLMILILANVFIAILSEAYSTISSESSDEDKIFSRLKDHIGKSLNNFTKKSKILRKFTIWKGQSVANIFNQADKNNDGQLSKSEIANAMNIDKEKAERIIQQFDKDGDQKLSPLEVQSLKHQLNVNEKQKQSRISINNKLQRIEKLLDQMNEKSLKSDKSSDS